MKEKEKCEKDKENIKIKTKYKIHTITIGKPEAYGPFRRMRVVNKSNSTFALSPKMKQQHFITFF